MLSIVHLTRALVSVFLPVSMAFGGRTLLARTRLHLRVGRR